MPVKAPRRKTDYEKRAERNIDSPDVSSITSTAPLDERDREFAKIYSELRGRGPNGVTPHTKSFGDSENLKMSANLRKQVSAARAFADTPQGPLPRYTGSSLAEYSKQYC